ATPKKRQYTRRNSLSTAERSQNSGLLISSEAMIEVSMLEVSCSNADRGMSQLTRLATHRLAADGGAGRVSGPVPAPRRRKTRAGMEPSRRGSAQEGRVVPRPSRTPVPREPVGAKSLQPDPCQQSAATLY